HDAAGSARDSHADVKLFRFGQRLLASDDYDRVGLPSPDKRLLTGDHHSQRANSTGVAIAAEAARTEPVKRDRQKAVLAPTDSDTQLVTALRQISSRFGHMPPAGIVLFSDGRARDETGVEQIASQFSRLGVPVHVLPTGSLGKRGDISIVAAVVP